MFHFRLILIYFLQFLSGDKTFLQGLQGLTPCGHDIFLPGLRPWLSRQLLAMGGLVEPPPAHGIGLEYAPDILIKMDMFQKYLSLIFFLLFFNQKEFRLKIFYFKFKRLSSRYMYISGKISLQSSDGMMVEKELFQSGRIFIKHFFHSENFSISIRHQSKLHVNKLIE